MTRAKRTAFERTLKGAQPATVRDDGRGGTIDSHPAFGQVMAFKTSGMTNLYGSDFPHQNYISIELHESELHRGLAHDRAHAGKRIVRFSMSEAQWGSFVSSFGRGEGTQVTITDRITQDGAYKMMPGLKPRNSADIYRQEARQHTVDSLSKIDELIADIEDDTLGLPVKKRAAILDKLQRARRTLGPDLEFVADQFDEMLEEREEKAKIEVTAWIDNHIRRAGLEALTGVAPPAIGDMTTGSQPRQLTAGDATFNTLLEAKTDDMSVEPVEFESEEEPGKRDGFEGVDDAGVEFDPEMED